MKTQVNFDALGGGGSSGKSGNILNSGSFTPSTSSFTEIEIGFVPTYIVSWLMHTNGHCLTILYDVTNSKYYRWYETESGVDYTNSFKDYIKMEGTKLKYMAPASGQVVATNYMAVKE